MDVSNLVYGYYYILVCVGRNVYSLPCKQILASVEMWADLKRQSHKINHMWTYWSVWNEEPLIQCCGAGARASTVDPKLFWGSVAGAKIMICLKNIGCTAVKSHHWDILLVKLLSGVHFEGAIWGWKWSWSLSRSQNILKIRGKK